MILKITLATFVVVGVLLSTLNAKDIKIKDGNFTVEVVSQAKIINADKMYKALGIGGKLNLVKNKFIKPEYSVGVGLIIDQPLIVDKDIAQTVMYSKINNDGEAVGTYYFNELYLNYEKDDWSVRVLTQSVDTPLIGSGTSLLMPNTYEGITYKRSSFNMFSNIKAGLLSSITGANGLPVTTADAKNRIGGNGIYFLGGDLKKYNSKIYLYTAPVFMTSAESYTALYLEKKNIAVAKGLDINIINTAYKTNSSFNLVGGKLKIDKYTVAMSMVSGDNNGVAYHFGNVPEYTKMEEFNLASLSAGTMAIKGETNLNYKSSMPMPIDLSVGLGMFMGKNKAGNYSKTIESGTIIDLKAKHKHNNKIDIVGLFEYQILKAISGKSVDSTMIVGLSAKYLF